MKFRYFVVYENNSDKFEIGHCPTKVKVMARFLNFSPFTAIQTDIRCVCLSDNNIQI